MVIDDIPLNLNEIIFNDRKITTPIPSYWSRIEVKDKKHWSSHNEIALGNWIQKHIGGLWAVHTYDFLELNEGVLKHHYTRKRKICIVISFENPDDKMMFELMGGLDAIT